MFRLLLTFLVGLPMLMPPGMCLCQFLPCGRASADDKQQPTPGQVTVSSGGDAAPSCGCRRRQSDSEQAKQEPGKPGGWENIPVEHSSPDRLPGQHAPDCPAAFTTATERVALLTFQVQALACLAPVFVGVVPASVQSNTPVYGVPSHVHSPPLFLSHCTLLI